MSDDMWQMSECFEMVKNTWKSVMLLLLQWTTLNYSLSSEHTWFPLNRIFSLSLLKLLILYQTIFITLRSLQLYLLFFRNYHCYPHRGPCLTAALWPGLWDYTRQGAILFTLVSLDMCSYHRFYPWISGTHPELHVHLSLFIPEAGEIWLSILVWSWNNT